MLKYIGHTVAIVFLAFCTISKGQAQVPQGARASTQSSPAQLAKHAQDLLPPDLASDVQEQIFAEAQDKLLKKRVVGRRSAATLFLADLFYNELKTGRFVGAPRIIWNGFDDKSGNPAFIYDSSDFAYVTADGRQIKPRKMDTDGGSIPKLLHSIGNFTPWTYGPAFIIHDWIFVAHKCGHAPDDNIDFDASAQVLAEAIKTLMEVGFTKADGRTQKFPKAEDTLYVMYLAVKSGAARDLWGNTSSVSC